LFYNPKPDDFTESHHSRAGGNAEFPELLKRPDSRFHGNERKAYFQDFYKTIKGEIFFRDRRMP